MLPSPNKKLRRAAIGCSILALLSVLIHQSTFVQRLEQATLDFRYRNFNRAAGATDRVVFIELDEASLKLLEPYYGRWPYPRRVYKDLLEFVNLGKPAGIFFDLLLTERTLGEKDDGQLAAVSRTLGNVSHAVQLLDTPAGERTSANPLPAAFLKKSELNWIRPPGAAFFSPKAFLDFQLPLPGHFEELPSVHVVNFDPDDDGVFRNAPLLFKYEDRWLPSLGLSAALSLLTNPTLEPGDHSLTIRSAGRKDIQLPLTDQGTLPLHFYKVDRGPQSISFAAVVQAAHEAQLGKVADPEDLGVNPMSFQGKAIFIGSSAVGLEDLKPTPVHPSYPGALLQATAVANILDGDRLTRQTPIVQLLYTVSLLVALYFCLFFFEGILLRVSLPLLLLIAAELTAILLFKYSSVGITMGMPGLLGLAAWLDGLASIAFVESAEKRRMKSTLSKYLSPVVTERLIHSGANPQAEVGRQEDLTILFSDIRGFTSLSETLPPRMIVECLNQYMGKMSDVLFEHTGTLDKFIGDSILAFWGAPLRDDYHALHAVQCAFAMKEALRHLNESWRGTTPARPEFKIGIGINTGKVIVGNIGSEKHLNYTVVGDNVNLASRLEGLTKEYKVFTVIGEHTQELIRESVICRLLDEVTVKGRSQRVKIYEPLAEKQVSTAQTLQELADRFHEAHHAYQEEEYLSALRQFSDLDSWLPGGDAPSRIYIERCRKLVAEKPLHLEKKHARSK